MYDRRLSYCFSPCFLLTAMDPFKELSKLEKLTAQSTGRNKTASISDSLDVLLASLQSAKSNAKDMTVESWNTVVQTIEVQKREIDDRQKEIYSTTAKLGKAIDKVCVRFTI